MARILVIYGTTEGQTARIANAIGDTLRTHGAAVDVVDASARAPAPDDYAAVVVAASVHAGGYQKPVRSWVRNFAPQLAGKPTAFVSVCLGVLQQDAEVQRELQSIIDRFLTRTGWHPTTIKIVAGALPYTRYNWLTRWIMKRIVTKAGGDTDTSRDYEYTDWHDLRAFAEQFGRQVDSGREAVVA